MDHQQNTGEVRIVSAQVLAQLQAAGYQVFVTQHQRIVFLLVSLTNTQQHLFSFP